MLVSQQHRYNSSYSTHPFASNFLTQFANWARIWVSSSPRSPAFTPRKRKLFLIDTKTIRDTDIRSRSNFYNQSHFNISSSSSNAVPTSSQRASLYRATCQKLRPTNHHSNLIHLGDIINVRHFWDDLEELIYEEMCGSSHRYVAPSKRMLFNPDKSSSKRSRNIPACHSQKKTRPSFSSSTIVYTLTTKQHIQILPICVNCRIQPRSQMLQSKKFVYQQPQQNHCVDDDDNIPLGALSFS
ncbi:hypothetical protein [Parasitella parasitica]|uniref:Uncharacterized protein n=1 Tax=Parasitella parasitica TaxID=35722 RepID=A0A0B7NK85_9FUNG|nr:hypothetical protein [Parasitella parasitica]